MNRLSSMCAETPNFLSVDFWFEPILYFLKLLRFFLDSNLLDRNSFLDFSKRVRRRTVQLFFTQISILLDKKPDSELCHMYNSVANFYTFLAI